MNTSAARHLYGEDFPEARVEAFDTLWDQWEPYAFMELTSDVYNCPESVLIADYFSAMSLDSLSEDDEERRIQLVRIFDMLLLRDVDAEDVLADVVDGARLYDPEIDDFIVIDEKDPSFVPCDQQGCWCHHDVNHFLDEFAVLHDEAEEYVSEDAESLAILHDLGLNVCTDECNLVILEDERIDLTPTQLRAWLSNLIQGGIDRTPA